MQFLEKLQKQPKHIRKIILWTVVVIIGLALVFWWVKSIQRSVRGFQEQEFIEKLNLPSFGKGLKEFPKIEIPEINEQRLMNKE